MVEGTDLYIVREDVRCCKCCGRGAIQFYGSLVEKDESRKYRPEEHISMACGFGGTIPYRCMNCGNKGLIDMGGLEGYDKAFETVLEGREI